MMKRTPLIAAFVLVALCGADVGPAAPSGTVRQPRQRELLVKFKQGREFRKTAIHGTVRAAVRRRLLDGAVDLVALPDDVTIDDGLRRYRDDPDVEFAEPNYRVRKAAVPDDPSYAVSQYALPLMHAPAAWDVTTGSSTIVVAVLDSGIDYTHPDLAANVWTNTGEIPGNGIDDDHNGYVDDVRGWNFAYPYPGSPASNNPWDDTADGHGTHVSGIIGAVGNNATGGTGVNWRVSIMPVKVLDDTGGGYVSDIVEGIEYAVRMNARVINSSFTIDDGIRTCSAFSLAENYAIRTAGTKGVLVVKAAGNSSCDLDNAVMTPNNPVKAGIANIIIVGASDSLDSLAWYSNYGEQTVHLAAPGTGIFSTINHGGYATYDGTSMAAPFVTGAAALLLAGHPAYAWQTVKKALLANAAVIPSFDSTIVTSSRLDIGDMAAGTYPVVMPAGLSATATASSCTLAWRDNSSGESGFAVERKVGAGAFIEIGRTGPNVRTYADGTVSEGDALAYRIRAFDGAGYSAYGAPLSVSVPLNTPDHLGITRAADGSVTLAWNDNSLLEDGYAIERKVLPSGSFVSLMTVPAGWISWVDASAAADTEYAYRVAAIKGGSIASPYSNIASTAAKAGGGGGGGGGACFIATAAYGSEHDRHVGVLREFRDRVLMPHATGRRLVALYYRLSPPVAEFVRQHRPAGVAVRALLTPVATCVEMPFLLALPLPLVVLFMMRRRPVTERRT